MGLRSALRELARTAAGRPSDDERLLGTGVWRRLHDRFHRAVDRYHQVIGPVAPGPLRDDLERCGARLATCWDAVREQCARAQATWPSDGLDIPGGRGVAARDVHARLSRAATQAAQAAEAATMARLRGSGSEAVDRAVAQVEALVATPSGP